MTAGADVDLLLKNGGLVVVARRRPTLKALLAKITARNRHAEVDTGNAEGGEVW